jgi:hypothetical protein
LQDLFNSGRFTLAFSLVGFVLFAAFAPAGPLPSLRAKATSRHLA